MSRRLADDPQAVPPRLTGRHRPDRDAREIDPEPRERSRRPVELVWTEELASRSQAMRREAEIKRLSAAEKQALVPAPGSAQRTCEPGASAARTASSQSSSS